MSLFGGAWRVEIFLPDRPWYPGYKWTETAYNGVDLNDFNGGEEAELIISATPTVEFARVMEHVRDNGSATVDSVTLATFTMKPALPVWQSSELTIEATDSEGQEVILKITPAEEVDDKANGFDIITTTFTVAPDGKSALSY